jgi:uncharacterized membrane protein
MANAPLSLEELRQLRKPLKNIAQEFQRSLNNTERLALWITKHVGSMGFFLIILAWTVLWLCWNTFAAEELRFDPFPAFVLWLFISNMIQILLMPLILVGQNLEGRHTEARASADYEVNTKAEREIETVLLHLETQNQTLERIERQLKGK